MFAEQIDGENYLLLMLMPPQVQVTGAHIPREMVFVIDTSGSMQGTSIVQARESLQMALTRLTASDRFNLIEFNSSHRALFANPVPATAANLRLAQNFVSGLNADGGTYMEPALAEALKGYAPENYLRQIVFITDGAVGNEAALFGLIENQLGDARLFTVGIGSAPNSYFMRKAAEFGRGNHIKIGDSSEVQTRMSALFLQLESPALSNIHVQWPNAAEQYPARTPDLYTGTPLVLAAKLDQLRGDIQISGETGDQSWQRTIAVAGVAGAPSAGVSTVWGRAKIESLMDEKIRGRDAEEVRAEVIKVALPLRLVSQYTSLVAVEEKIVRTEEKLSSSAVPNVVAQGQVQQPGTYPLTATWMPLNFLLGSLALGIWLILRRKGIA